VKNKPSIRLLSHFIGQCTKREFASTFERLDR